MNTTSDSPENLVRKVRTHVTIVSEEVRHEKKIEAAKKALAEKKTAEIRAGWEVFYAEVRLREANWGTSIAEEANSLRDHGITATELEPGLTLICRDHVGYLVGTPVIVDDVDFNQWLRREPPYASDVSFWRNEQPLHTHGILASWAGRKEDHPEETTLHTRTPAFWEKVEGICQEMGISTIALARDGYSTGRISNSPFPEVMKTVRFTSHGRELSASRPRNGMLVRNTH